MPTAPRTMLATPRPTSTKERRSRLQRILRLEHILPQASLQLQQEEVSARRERIPQYSAFRRRRGSAPFDPGKKARADPLKSVHTEQKVLKELIKNTGKQSETKKKKRHHLS
ncbi:hypothetical protein CHARACLAT_030069 [Characodon lateralis]|uniref:Uncharacterized protein n=1 Tax=Characodon lateralis TaxID=208331 RepID=A0ABU7EE09_9TELE|nr:hypothetical protein [Characodon lateralis]